MAVLDPGWSFTTDGYPADHSSRDRSAPQTVSQWDRLPPSAAEFGFDFEVKQFIESREAFAYDRENPNSGYRYLSPPPDRKP